VCSDLRSWNDAVAGAIDVPLASAPAGSAVASERARRVGGCRTKNNERSALETTNVKEYDKHASTN